MARSDHLTFEVGDKEDPMESKESVGSSARASDSREENEVNMGVPRSVYKKRFTINEGMLLFDSLVDLLFWKK